MSITSARGLGRAVTHWGGVALFAGPLVVLAFGFCFFGGMHAGMDCHTVFPDLCPAMLVASFVPVLLVELLAAGWLRLEPVRSLHSVPLHRLDPPPKFRSLS